MTIDVLPDDATLEIFDSHMDQARQIDGVETWRNIVLASPRRLNLQLICRTRTS